MRKTTVGKRILVMVLAFVMLLSGIIPSGFSIQTVKAADTSIVWFEYDDERPNQYLDDANTITLKTTDKGYFRCGDSSLAGWQCKYYRPGGGYDHVLIVKETGEFSYDEGIEVPYTFRNAEAYNTNSDTIKKFNLKIEADEVGLDTSALETVISSASSIIENGQGNYTSESWNALRTALTNAQTVLNAAKAENTTTTQTEIDAAKDALDRAYKGLQQGTTAPAEKYVYFEPEGENKEPIGHITDGQTLTVKLTEKGTFKLNGNTGSGNPHWTGSSSIQTETGAFLPTEVKTSECVAISSDGSFRISFTLHTTTDTDALTAAIAEARQIVNNNYTAASWSNFSTALTNAQEMLDRADTEGTTQAQVNTATGNLQTAKNALVPESSQPGRVDVDGIVSKGIASASSWLNAQGYKYECNGVSDWYIMSKLRSGQTISDANKEAYYESATATVATWNADQDATDIERVALTLSAMGKDITDVNGVNLAAMIYNHEKLGDFSNSLIWGLIALDATAQEIPAEAKWNRASMVAQLLTFQNAENGGFCYVGTSWTDVDMSAMAIQALAPYYGDAKVKASVDKAFTYIKANMDTEYGFTTAESAAQVLLALASMKMDPATNGFGTEYTHIVSTLDKYYAVAAGGFAHVKNGYANAVATYQTMEGLEAYRRFKASEAGYWDMTDVKPSKPEEPEQPKPFDLTCSAEDVTGTVGDTVTVKIKVSSDTKLGGIQGEVANGYDKDILKLTDIKYTDGFGEGIGATENIGFTKTGSFTSGTIELKFAILKCTDKAVEVRISDLFACDEDGSANVSKTYDLTAKVHVNHKVQTVAGKAATCTENGLSDGQKCAVCGKILKEQKVDTAKGHKETTVPARAATCTATGLTEGKICSTCKTVLQKQNVTPALGHSFGAWTTTVASTVMAEGQQTRTCTRCGHSETQALAKLQPNAALAIHNFPLKVKQSYTVKVNNIAAGDSVVSWKSSNTKIVTVNNAGKVTGKKKGTATITATLASGQVLSTTVKVQTGTVKTTGITVNSRNVTLKAKAGFQIQATRNPETSQQAISYSTSNKKVATVTKKGYIKGVKAGKATITVKSGSKKVKINVIVEGVKTTGLTANKTEITLKKKKSFAWKVKKVPTNSSEDITYSTSNKKVATVNKNGKISAKKAGTATITAKSGTQKITINVTVK